MGLVNFLQRKDREGGGKGIVPNALANLIYKNFIEPRLEDQRGSQQHQITNNALKKRALIAAAQQRRAPAPVVAAPAPVAPTAVDPYAEFSNLRQFRDKSNRPIDSALMRLVVDIAKKHSIEPKLAGALAIQESDWNPNSVGGTAPPGMGLYQLTPGAKGNENRWDEKRIHDPEYNANEGLSMILNGLQDADKLGFTGEKRTRHALRRYNGGNQYWRNTPGWGGKTVNQNTKDYADSVMSWYNK